MLSYNYTYLPPVTLYTPNNSTLQLTLFYGPFHCFQYVNSLIPLSHNNFSWCVMLLYRPFNSFQLEVHGPTQLCYLCDKFLKPLLEQLVWAIVQALLKHY